MDDNIQLGHVFVTNAKDYNFVCKQYLSVPRIEYSIHISPFKELWTLKLIRLLLIYTQNKNSHERVILKVLQNRYLIHINVIIFIFKSFIYSLKVGVNQASMHGCGFFLAPNEFEGNKHQVLGFIKL